MVTFDTIRLEFDLSVLCLELREIANKQLNKIKVQYGTSSLFLRSTLSPLEIQFKELTKTEDVSQYIDNDTLVTQKDKKYYYLPSYSYKLNLIRQNDVIVSEFSIPKYLYGHNLNIFPSVDYSQKLYYHEKQYLQKLIEQNKCNSAVIALVCLKHFLSEFCNKIFGLNFEVLNPRVLRLDVCYNYRFSTRMQFENFQSCMQKFFNQKVWRGRYTNYYNETFEKVTDAYSVKLYDKEKEFVKHDMSKLKKYFSLPFLGLSDEAINGKLSALQDFAKNVWRCEIACRSSFFVDTFFKHYDKFSFDEKKIYRSALPYWRKVENLKNALLRFKSGFDGENLNERQIKVLTNIIEKFYNVLSFDVQKKCLLCPFSNDVHSLMRFAQMANFYFVENFQLPKKFFNHIYIMNWEKVNEILTGKQIRFFGHNDLKTIVVDDVLLSLFHERMENYVNIVSQVHVNNYEYLKILKSKKLKNDVQNIIGRQTSPLIDFILASETNKNLMYFGYSKKQYNRNNEKLKLLLPLLQKVNDCEKFDLYKIWENINITTFVNDVDKKILSHINNYKLSLIDVMGEFNEFLYSDNCVKLYSLDYDELFDFVVSQFNGFFARMHEGLCFENICSVDKIRSSAVWLGFVEKLKESQNFQN